MALVDELLASFSQAPAALAIVALDGTLRRVNDAFSTMLRHEAGALEGILLPAITRVDSASSASGIGALIDASTNRYQIHARLLRKDGHLIPALLTRSLARDADGAATHFVFQAEEMDEAGNRADARDRQARLNETFVEATTEMGHGITIYRRQRMEFVNDAYVKMLGYSQQEIIRMPDPLEVIAPEEREKLRERLARRLAGEAVPNHYETLFQRKDGSTFPAEVSVARHHGAEGYEAVTLVKDITERRRAEAEAKRQVVARNLVRRILRDVTAKGDSSASQRRAMGRSLANEATAGTIDEMLDSFHSMNIGTLTLTKATDDRWEFTGHALLEVTPGFSAPTCQIPLGFLEGMIARLSGQKALGAEMRCESQSAAHSCTFVVKRSSS